MIHESTDHPDNADAAHSSAQRVDAVWNVRWWSVAVPIVLVVVYAFWPAIENGFVDWDDPKNFLQNPHFQGLGPSQLVWAWTTFWLGVYQPFAWMLLEIQHALWGLNPWGYHILSIVLHALNSIVLYVLTRTLLGRAQPKLCKEHPGRCSVSAGLATALFAVHPLRTEVVAWASCQPYLPCALFYWSAVLFYVRAFPQPGGTVRRSFWISYLCFIGALLSKAVAISLPFVLLLVDIYPLKRIRLGNDRGLDRFNAAVLREKIPFFALSALFMLLALAARPHGPILPGANAASVLERLARTGYGIWFYVSKTVWPFSLTVFYAVPKGTSPLEWRFVASIVATIVVTVAAYRLRRSYPWILVAWSSYLVILLPNLGLVSISRQLASDRYSYVAMIGFVVVFAGILNAQWPVSRIGRSVGYAVATALFAALIVLTKAQCRTWQSSEVLWTHALSHGGETVQEVQNAVGLALLELGRLEEARRHFHAAIQLEPRYGVAHNSLGTLLARQGQYTSAKAEFAESIRLTPQDPIAHNNLGNILLSEGQVEPAVREYATAVSLDPEGGVARLDDLLVLRRSTLRPRLVPLIRAVVAGPRDQTALRELERALTSPDK